MPEQKPFEPGSAFGGDDLAPPNPWRIPGKDWTVLPRFNPFMDEPDPRGESRPAEPRTRGGDPPAPGPWGDLFDGPTPPPAPANPFTPEAQAAIKEKRRQEEAARKAQLRKEWGLDGPTPPDERGDYPMPSGDPAA